MRTLLVCLLLLLPASVAAEPPPNPPSNFDTAKAIARDKIYVDHRTTLYCGCDYEPATSRSGGVIEPSACGYEVRMSETRGARLEWEHIMPASEFGHLRTCWRLGHPDCVKDGKLFKGRRCCGKSGVDPEFRRMEADLHNLVPSVGELNGDRSNHPYGIIEGEPREYGACDFEVGGSPKVAEPSESVRGDVARVWLYMSETYNVRLSRDERMTLQAWSASDPPDEWELLRNTRIEAEQGNRNPFVKP